MAEKYNWSPSITSWVALVKMDDFAKTKSTGGTVKEVAGFVSEGYMHFPEVPSDHRVIFCGKDVRPGWIYQDKTHIFVDSNKQS